MHRAVPTLSKSPSISSPVGSIPLRRRNSLKEKGKSLRTLFLPVKNVEISELRSWEFEPVANTFLPSL